VGGQKFFWLAPLAKFVTGGEGRVEKRRTKWREKEGKRRDGEERAPMVIK